MRWALLALGGAAAAMATVACSRRAPATGPTTPDEFVLADRACKRGEPGGCDRRALEYARRSCASGRIEGCDDYELARSLCLQDPRGPLCAALRRRGDVPAEPPPVAEVFGCHTLAGPLEPRAVLCMAEDRVSVRGAGGAWQQWLVSRWGRQDTTTQAVHVATLVDGPPLQLAVVAAGETCDPVAVRSGGADQPARSPAIACEAVTYHVVGLDGLLSAQLADRDPGAEAELAVLPTVEQSCADADACAQAIVEARMRATPPDPGDIEREGPGLATGARTLHDCRARSAALVAGRVATGQVGVLPSACRHAYEAGAFDWFGGDEIEWDDTQR